MAISRLSIITSLALALGGVVAQQPEAPGRVSTLVRNAEAHLTYQRFDSALELLLRAEQSLSEVDSVEERDAIRSTLEDMLRQADPLDQDRRKVQQQIAEKLVVLARMYRRRGWYSLSLSILDEIDQLAPEIGTEERHQVEEALRKKSRRDAPKDEAADSQPDSNPQDILQNLEVLTRTKGWRKDPSGVQSPRLPDAETVYLLGKAPQHNDNRISVELQMGPVVGKAALAFGIVDQSNYYLAELNQAKDALSSLILWRVGSSSEMDWLEVAYFDLTAEQASDWLELVVDVRGAEISASINGHTARTTCEAPPYGGIGLWISGNSENKEPVHFRNLLIQDLPPKGEVEIVTGDKSAAELLPERIAGASSMFRNKQHEEGVLELRRIRACLSIVDAESDRAALESEIEALLSEHDPEHKKSEAVRKEIATLYLELAEQYSAQDRPLAALAILERASQLDREVPAAMLASLQKAVGPRPTNAMSASAPAAMSNAEMHELLDGGREFTKGGWRWRDDALVSPELLDTRSVHVTKELYRMTGSASVEMRATEHAGAALVFGWRSKNDFFYLGFDRRGDTDTAVVARWKNEHWQTLDRRVIDLPDTQEWVEVMVGFHDRAIEIQIGEIGPLILENDQLDFRGKCGFGLMGWGDGQGGRASFRYFDIEE